MYSIFIPYTTHRLHDYYMGFYDGLLGPEICNLPEDTSRLFSKLNRV